MEKVFIFSIINNHKRIILREKIREQKKTAEFATIIAINSTIIVNFMFSSNYRFYLLCIV